jgi:small subunit ribosomal protein S9
MVKDTTTKDVKKVKAAPKAVAKKRVIKKKVETKEAPKVVASDVVIEQAPVEVVVSLGKPELASGRYVFATGRRKTAVANIRLLSGSSQNQINKKPLEKYFSQSMNQDRAIKALQLTGLAGDFYFTATVNGGGINAQAQAVQHGIAQALASLGDDIRKVLKKNGMLTRDDRKKERKKPGLRGARRSPQWAKR